MNNELAPTECINENTVDIDIKDTFGILKLINDEDKKVALAVEKSMPEIAKATDIIYNNFLCGGRLFYFGAGTSGRLGVLDASECPPTFSVSPMLVQGVIAGGDSALRTAVEGAEDSKELAQEDFKRLNINQNDTVMSISASGNAAYVVEILRLAKEKNIKTLSLTNNKNSLMKQYSDVCIFVDTGSEVITGSTRMKAGTSQKLVLNMLTTASMIKLGKVYNNLMVDVAPTNKKLKERAIRITTKLTEKDVTIVLKMLEDSDYDVKASILALKYSISLDDAKSVLNRNKGILKLSFNELDRK